VVASNRAALPETCGDAALLVDPDDGEALTRALGIAAGDAAARGALRAAGLRRAAQFSWDRTAERVDALLTSVADAHGG
jgi:glycosyltransferase involved in cell wall biosynthesis